MWRSIEKGIVKKGTEQRNFYFRIFLRLAHCKDKMPKIWNKYSQERNIGASARISTFMCLLANYIFPRWVCLFCWRKYVDRSWEYINRSQTHKCGNWGWGRAIPRKGIHKWNCRCSASALWLFVTSFSILIRGRQQKVFPRRKKTKAYAQ